jgi:ATP-dependent Lon protease
MADAWSYCDSTIKRVLIPEENVKDLVEISDEVEAKLEIVPVSRMEEVLREALRRMPKPLEWREPHNNGQPVPTAEGSDSQKSPSVRAH